MKAEDIINWGELSRHLSGSRYTVRKNKIPKLHADIINEMLKYIDVVLNNKNIGEKLCKTNNLYYIQCGYVGNALCWWRPEGKGYTTNINEAGKYSEKEAKDQALRRIDDVVWECDYIDKNQQAHKTVIDSQYVDYDKSFRGRTN